MKRLAFVAALAALAIAAFGLPSSNEYLAFLSAAQREALASSGELTSFGSKPAELGIWQGAPFAAAVRASLSGGSSSIAAEGLFLVDLPKGGTEDLGLLVPRAFTAFSTMKGLQVYSASLKKMETFIFASHRIGTLEGKLALPDPVFEAPPKHAEFLLYQKEEQTGDVYSLMDFDARDGLFLVRLTNLTELRYLFFQLVPPRGLETVFVIAPTEDKLVLYGITAAATPRFLGLENAKRSSFFYRMKALASWFGSNLARQQ